jgi:hypothetical protein
MMYILRVILDAAILYSVALLIVLISFTRSNNGNIVMLYMVIFPLLPVIEPD